MIRQTASGQEPARLGNGILTFAFLVAIGGVLLVAAYCRTVVLMLAPYFDGAALVRAIGLR